MWNWCNFWFSFGRSLFLCIGIQIINPNLGFWWFAFAVASFLIAMEMTVHLIRYERESQNEE